MANSDDLIISVGKNSNDTAALVWSVADDLVGAYKPHEYGLVILPMTVIKRFHDCLLPTHQKVLDTYKKVEKLVNAILHLLMFRLHLFQRLKLRSFILTDKIKVKRLIIIRDIRLD